MTQRTQRLSRRSFLLTLGAGGAAAAAAIAAKSASPGLVPHEDKPVKRGYQATVHVNEYYRTAKV
jgi:hypothetical protein